jgi:hypothetical protein
VTAESIANIQPAKAAFVDADRSVDVTRAKLLFTSFLIEHNVALSAVDHAGSLFRMMFPDSELAKNYGSARTKTTCTISALAHNSQSTIVAALQEQQFSVSTDGSNDS